MINFAFLDFHYKRRWFGVIHKGGLTGHLERKKTMNVVIERCYWPYLRLDIGKFVQRCYICQFVKGKTQNTSLYVCLFLKIYEQTCLWILYLDYLVSDWHNKFLSHFWQTLWRMYDSSLQFSSIDRKQMDI